MRLLLPIFVGLAAAVATPAAAQNRYVFGTSDGAPFPHATLTFDSVTPFTVVDTGWIRSDGAHVAGNTNYITGSYLANNFNSYFSFALGALAPVSPYTSAVLTINTTGDSAGTFPELLTLFDVNATSASLTANRSPGDATGIALYNDLGSGASYGSYNFTAPTVAGGTISIALNSTFLNQVNQGLLTNFSIGGTLTPSTAAVPETATWGMMIVGFGAVGFALRRRVRRSEEEFDTKLKRIAEGEVA